MGCTVFLLGSRCYCGRPVFKKRDVNLTWNCSRFAVKWATNDIFDSRQILNRFEVKLFSRDKLDGVCISVIHRINYKLLKILFKPD